MSKLTVMILIAVAYTRFFKDNAKDKIGGIMRHVQINNNKIIICLFKSKFHNKKLINKSQD